MLGDVAPLTDQADGRQVALGNVQAAAADRTADQVHRGHADGHAAVVMAAGVVLDSHLARDRLDQPDVAQLVQALAELSTLTRVFSSGGGVAGGVCDFRT